MINARIIFDLQTPSHPGHVTLSNLHYHTSESYSSLFLQDGTLSYRIHLHSILKKEEKIRILSELLRWDGNGGLTIPLEPTKMGMTPTGNAERLFR